MVLSSKVTDGELYMLEGIHFDTPKTKTAAAMLKKLIPQSNSVLMVTPAKDRAVERAVRNLPHAAILSADSLNIHDLLSKKYLILTKESVPVISTIYGAKK